MRRWTQGCLVAWLLLGSGCAWARRDNRPVWNAFEAHLVPESTGTFVATLPLTVPAGLLAIAVDTLVAHPIQVLDDAWDDSVGLWHDVPFAAHYYTQSALLPVRAAATPVWFAGSFVLRSLFDIRSEAQREPDQRRLADRRHGEIVRCLQDIAAGGAPEVRGFAKVEADAALRAAVAAAAAAASPAGRLQLYELAGRQDWVVPELDWCGALGDPSAVVRYHVLGTLPPSLVVPVEVREQLLRDPDPAVRWRAGLFWR